MTAARRTARVTASLGTLLTLVAFTAPIATREQHRRGAGRRHVGPHLDPQLDEHRPRARRCCPPARVADDFGRRRTFVAGMRGARGRARCSAAVVARASWSSCWRGCVQGVGGAAVIASSLGHHRGDLPRPGRERAAASGVWGASVGAGIAVGPLLVGRARPGRLAGATPTCVAGRRPGGRASRALRLVRRVRGRRSAPGSTCPGCVLLAGGHERAAGRRWSRAGRAGPRPLVAGARGRRRGAARSRSSLVERRSDRADARPRAVPAPALRGRDRRGAGHRRRGDRPDVVPPGLRRPSRSASPRSGRGADAAVVGTSVVTALLARRHPGPGARAQRSWRRAARGRRRPGAPVRRRHRLDLGALRARAAGGRAWPAVSSTPRWAARPSRACRPAGAASAAGRTTRRGTSGRRSASRSCR